MNKTIFIVEDDENIRQMIKMALTSFGYAVTAFDNAEDALTAVCKQQPDLMIFDIMLPEMSGLEAVAQLKASAKTEHIPIVMLTAKDSEMDKVTGLDYGADDYITKPFGVMELGARIRSIFRRVDKVDAPPAEEIIAAADLTINNQTREVKQGQTILELTFKEYELLCMLIGQRDRIVPREELLNTVWGFDFLGESRTLDIHIRTLRQKLATMRKTRNILRRLETWDIDL